MSNTTALKVAQLSYNLSSWAEYGPTSSDYAFWGATASVQRASFAAATAGEVPNVPHTFMNESYHLDFHGPAIQCTTANDSVRNATQYNINANWGSGGYYQYWSWVGDDDHGLLSINQSLYSNLDLKGTWETLDASSTDAARIWVFSATGAAGEGDNFRNVSECLLHNATYSVDFDIQNGNSVATVQKVHMGEMLAPLSTSQGVLGLQPNESIQYSYQSVMDAMGKLLVGYGFAQNDATETTYTSFLRTYVNWNELEATQRGLEELFQNITMSMFSSSDLL